MGDMYIKKPDTGEDLNVTESIKGTIIVTIPADGTNTDIWDVGIYSARVAFTITKLSIITESIFGQATNNSTLTFKNGANSIVGVLFDAAAATAALTEYDFVADGGGTLSAYKTFAVNDVLVLNKAKTTGNGQIVPRTSIIIEYEILG